MNDQRLIAELRAIHAERASLPNAPVIRSQLLAIPLGQASDERGFLSRRSQGRYQSMLSATKLLVAGSIVALFGGFLLTGVLTQPPSETDLPAIGASASPTALAEPTPDPSIEPVAESAAPLETTTRSDLVPGVELVTEEVEPGVLRIVNDGVRELTIPFEQGGRKLLATAPDGNVWVLQDRALFRLGDTGSRSGPYIDDLDVDFEGNVWAVGVRLAKKTFGCPNEGFGSHLLRFDGARWTAERCDVTDFQLGTDGSLWVAGAESPDSRDLELRVLDDRKVTNLGSGLELFAASPSDPDADPGWDSLWTVDDDRGYFGLSRISLRECPPHCMDSDWQGAGLDGSVEAFGFGEDRSSWVFVEFEDAVLADGMLTSEPARYLVRFAPMPVEPGAHLGRETTGTPEQVGAYPAELGSARLTGSPRLEVAPDGAVWLPTDDGLARFDGETWDMYLGGQHVEDVDVASDGTAWVTASRYSFDPETGVQPGGTTSVYVIAP